MQKLDCFKNRFGPDVVSRVEKPSAAAKEALEQARMRAAKWASGGHSSREAARADQIGCKTAEGRPSLYREFQAKLA